jgi:hypothetical protein
MASYIAGKILNTDKGHEGDTDHSVLYPLNPLIPVKVPIATVAHASAFATLNRAGLKCGAETNWRPSRYLAGVRDTF